MAVEQVESPGRKLHNGQATAPASSAEVAPVVLETAQIRDEIEKSRLFAEAQQRVRELTSLMQVSQTINRAEGLDTVMNIVLDEVFNLMGSQEGTIILIDPPGSNRLRIVAERGLGPEVVEAFNNRPVYSHEGTYRHALREGRIVEIPDPSIDPDFLTDVGSRARSVTNVPVCVYSNRFRPACSAQPWFAMSIVALVARSTIGMNCIHSARSSSRKN